MAYKRPPLWGVWSSMIQRCTNPNRIYYEYYGGRGITVCERWRILDNFVQDMGPRPPGSTLDRINPDGHYEPQNCRWATRLEQRLNQKRTKFYEYKGETLWLSELARRYNINFWCLRTRVEKLGWDIDKAIETPAVVGQKTRNRNSTQ